MASRSNRGEKVQIGIQSAAGSVATKLYDASNLGLKLGTRASTDVFEPANARIPSDVDVSAEWMENSIDSRVFYDYIGFLLASAFGAPTTTTLTGTYKHVWTIRDSSFPARKLLTIQKGNATNSEQSLDNFVKQIGWSVERTGSYAMTARTVGQPFTNTALGTVNGTAGRVRALAKKTGFYKAATSDALVTALSGPNVAGTTWAGNAFAFAFNTADMAHPKWILNPASSTWADYIDDSISPTIDVTVEANTHAMSTSTGLVADMRNNAVVYIGGKVYSTAPISGSEYYLFQWEAAAQIVPDSLDEGDTQGVVSYPFKFQVVDDGAFSLRFTLKNQISNLSDAT